jgi:hypothetical protein
MKYLIGGTLRPERTREEFVARIKGNPLSHEVWELIRKGVITEHGFRIGSRPGFVFVIEGDSEEAVMASLADIPLIRDGWFDVEVDPVSPFVSDIR